MITCNLVLSRSGQEKRVNLLEILTTDLSFEYIEINTSKKSPRLSPLLSLSNSFSRVVKSKAFLKSMKHEKIRFCFFFGIDFTYLSISAFKVEMRSSVPCIFSETAFM